MSTLVCSGCRKVILPQEAGCRALNKVRSVVKLYLSCAAVYRNIIRSASFVQIANSLLPQVFQSWMGRSTVNSTLSRGPHRAAPSAPSTSPARWCQQDPSSTICPVSHVLYARSLSRDSHLCRGMGKCSASIASISNMVTSVLDVERLYAQSMGRLSRWKTTPTIRIASSVRLASNL